MKYRIVLVAALTLSFLASGLKAQETDREIRLRKMKTCRKLLKTTLGQIDRGEYQYAVLTLDSVLFCDSSNADAYYYKGMIHIQLNDTATALSSLETGVKRAPLSSRLKILLARLYLAAENIDSAQQLLDKVLAIKPRESEAIYLKGLAHASSGQNQEAVALLKKALELALQKDKR